MCLRATHLHALTHHRSPIDIIEQIIYGCMGSIIYIHPEREQSEPLLLDLIPRRTCGFSDYASLPQPCKNSRITRWVRDINRAHRSPRAPYDVVRDPAALGCVCSAAEATPLVNQHTIGRHCAVPMMLSRLPTKVLIEGRDVDRS